MKNINDVNPNAVAQTIQTLRDIHVETERDDRIRVELRRLLKVDSEGSLCGCERLSRLRPDRCACDRAGGLCEKGVSGAPQGG